MSIVSINVNGFCGGCNKCNPNSKVGKCFEIRKSYIKKIKTFINLNNENDLAIIQEIPCEYKIYNFLEKEFNDFIILKPNHLQSYAKQCTIAIFSERSNWKRAEERLKYSKNEKGIFDFGNKFVELQLGEITLLGVHMPNDKNMWKNLIDTIKDKNKFSIIIGDFNAHENIHRGMDKISDNLKKIRECGYKDLVSNDLVTYYPAMTTIDHLFYQTDRKKLESTSLNVIPTNLSDHVCLWFEFTI